MSQPPNGIWLVQLFLHSSSLYPTQTERHTDTDHTTCDICSNRPHPWTACRWCGQKTSLPITCCGRRYRLIIGKDRNDHRHGVHLFAAFGTISIACLFRKMYIHARFGYSNFAVGAATCRTRPNNVVLDFGPLAPLCENMTSSRKPEVHSALHNHQRRTEPQAHVACTEDFVEFGHVVFEICERRDRQTDKQTNILTYWHTDSNTSPTYGVGTK